MYPLVGSTVAFTSRFAYIFGNCGHVRSQGGRQHAAAKPPVHYPTIQYCMTRDYCCEIIEKKNDTHVHSVHLCIFSGVTCPRMRSLNRVDGDSRVSLEPVRDFTRPKTSLLFNDTAAGLRM